MDEAQTGAEATSTRLAAVMKKTQTEALIVNSDIAEKQKGGPDDALTLPLPLPLPLPLTILLTRWA
jgi:hypothetical protein